MNVEIIVRIGGREVAVVEDQIQATSVLELEEHVERLGSGKGDRSICPLFRVRETKDSTVDVNTHLTDTMRVSNFHLG